MQNPNYHISKTKIILKNLPKRDFDEEELREVVMKILSEKFEEKILKKKKIISKIKVEREKDRVYADGVSRNRGFAFVEFVQHEDALFFLNKIKDKYTLINKNRIPIVEFAFEDAKELRRRNEILKKIEGNRNTYSKKDDVPKEEIERKAKERKNAQTAAKLLIENLLENATKTDLEKLREHLHNVKSRGLKQRLKTKIAEKLGIEFDEVEKNKTQKLDRSQSVKADKKKNQEKAAQKENFKKEVSRSRSRKPRDEEDLEELNKIKKTIKNKRKEKRRAEEHDNFDKMADKYLKKVQKV